MKRIEALGLAIARENGFLDPGSESFQTLNPGLIHAHVKVPEREQPVNGDSIRVFTNVQSGWQALINNLQAKCEGRTRANGYDGVLAPTSSLRDLGKTFRIHSVRHIVEFLQDALDDKAIGEHTKLAFFIEGANGRDGNSAS